MSDALRLAAAQARLGKPGRPRKAASAVASSASAPSSAINAKHSYGTAVPGVCPPRLLDLDAGAAYLALSPWTVRDLIAAGILARVRIPLPNGANSGRCCLTAKTSTGSWSPGRSAHDLPGHDEGGPAVPGERSSLHRARASATAARSDMPRQGSSGERTTTGAVAAVQPGALVPTQAAGQQPDTEPRGLNEQ
jgi:hypothetical protein